jgi:hypothetical protein
LLLDLFWLGNRKTTQRTAINWRYSLDFRHACLFFQPGILFQVCKVDAVFFANQIRGNPR